MKILKVEVFGRVQGIGLRKKIRKYAIQRDLIGFVRNRKNGGVEIFVRGSREKLKEFILFLLFNSLLRAISLE